MVSIAGIQIMALGGYLYVWVLGPSGIIKKDMSYNHDQQHEPDAS